MSEKRSAWIDRDPVEEQPLPLADLEELEELEEEKLYVASYSQLMWWHFIKHRMAVISGVVFLLLYLVASLSEFIASYNPEANFLDYQLATPSRIRWVVEGRLKRPFVYGVGLTRNPVTMRRFYTETKEVKYPIRFFVEGLEYKMWGLFPANVLGQGIFILGTDQVGRDVFSRICYGARVSLTICLVSVIISLGLGIIWGGLSGYYGGMLDNAIQRLIEFIRSIPEIPLIMALAAALPIDMGIIARYFMVDHAAGLCRLDRLSSRGTGSIPFITARRRLRNGDPLLRFQRNADHPAPHAAFLHEPRYSFLDLSRAGYDSR